MRKITAAVIALFVSAPAFAADIPRPVYKGAAYVAAPNWSGPYAGVNIGYGWGNAPSDFSVTITQSTRLTDNVVRAGLNYRF